MKQRILYFTLALTLLFAVPMGSYALFNKVQKPDECANIARELFRENKWAEGKKVLDEYWADYGSMSVMNELMGRYYYHYKKYDKARFYLVRAVRDDKSNNLARELLVNVEEETKNYSSAICYVNELLEENPYSRALWRRKINIYRKQGNTDEANRLLERLQTIYPNDAVVLKDVAYINELRLAKQRKRNDVNGQIESLTNLVNACPNNADYYYGLANVLHQAGRIGEAEEVSARGAKLTGNVKLMIQRASMLNEQGKYVEALNYLKECQKKKNSKEIESVINQTEVTAAENAQLNDPYTSMARVYSKQHSREALQYLLNTSIARGYYEDALMYIRDAKDWDGETEDILYKEFLVHRRLGNKSKSINILQRLYNMNAKNADVAEYLSEMRYESAATLMGAGLFADAIEDLQFAEANAYDDDVRRGAMLRLFNCYMETRRYEQAHEQLEKLRKQFNYANYSFQKGALLKAEGRVEAALIVLSDAYDATMDPLEAQLLAFQYEEYALPYVKDMIRRGMIHQADKVVKKAILVCPTSNELLHCALTTSDILGNYEDFEEMIIAGRARYPEDPFFIVKEAGLYAHTKDYAGAVALLRPELDIYLGDSAVVKTFAEYSQKLALEQADKKAYGTALATLDTALVFKHKDPDLLYTKGLIFERMHEYDSAYVYQYFYQPTLMDYRQHSHHLEELMGQLRHNEISLTYQQGGAGDEERRTSNLFATYTRREEFDDITLAVGYTGKEDIILTPGLGGADDPGTSISGGAAVRLGADYMHRFKGTPWAVGVGAAWSNNFFPKIAANASVEREMGDMFSLNLHAGYKRIYAYDVDARKLSYNDLALAGLQGEKSLGKFLLRGGADAYYINKVYVSGRLHGEFFPVELSRTHLYMTIGAGNAPQQEQLDNAMACGFGKLSTFVEGGFYWVFNRHIGASVSGSWYTMQKKQDIQCGEYFFSIPANGNYRNSYYLQGKVDIRF